MEIPESNPGDVLLKDEYTDDARVSLLRRGSGEDVEEAKSRVAQPAWAGRVEGLNYQITR